eukprot:TRINITY_DN1274_c0_g1_i2.p1 TRINITY_DN1274_c0_g1~~TRINITY_DN1274_c0_g1_i2.p1  ORF type:complete len:657 (+),score=175.53 TRINITY_DN1274_c0_g1_i2:192-2162(+)
MGRSRSRGRRGSRSRDRERSKDRKKSRSRRRKEKKARSASESSGGAAAAAERSLPRRSRSRKRSRTASPPRKARRRSRTPERTPPTDFKDYEPAEDAGGWYVYKKTGKWKYHPETGLYLHCKSKVYYVQKEGDAKSYRKIEDEEDPVVRKMRQSEEMRKAIQSTEFVQFDPNAPNAAADPANLEEVMAQKGQAPGPSAPPPEVLKEEVEEVVTGKVQKWDSEKGFGFVVAAPKEKDPKDKDKEEAVKPLFVHRKNIMGSTPTNPINLREGAKVQFKIGEQDKKPCALEVVMLGTDGKVLAIHAGAQNLEEKKKSYYVTATALGVRVHAESWPGLKKTLQDRYVSDEAMEELGVYFGVFDGHGGTQVADHAQKSLHKAILQQMRLKQVQPASRDEKIRLAVKEAFLLTDKEILQGSERKKADQVGSTAVCALIHGNPKLGTALRLVVANLGDSRAVLCRGGQAIAVSEDHKPNRHDEKKRVERAGGLVLQIRGTARVAAPMNPNATNKAGRREYQGLAMSRSFGDIHFKTPIPLCVAEPETQIVPLTDKDLFVVLATDGIFDVLGNQEVVDLAIKHWDDPEEAAKVVVRTAYKKGSEDNLTVQIIQFGWSDKNAPRYLENRKHAAAMAAAQEDGASVKIQQMVQKAKPADDGMDMFG